MGNSTPRPMIWLMGPTASGKSAVARRLADEVNGEIVSVDSASIYRGLDIGTAKPTPAEQARHRHHLLDICDPQESYSVVRFRTDALAAIKDIQARGKVPVCVGGTGLYFKALNGGLSELPASDPDRRAALENDLLRQGSPYMHARLAEVDPDSANRIHPNDPQRILRALEVYRTSGEPMSRLLREAKRDPVLSPPPVKLVLASADRDWLHRRIEQRFRAMLRAGFVNEVAALYSRADLDLAKPALRAVGYRAIWRYLAGEYSFEEMRERGVIATRQLAKRQYTWFRGVADAQWFDACEATCLGKLIVAAKTQIEIEYERQ